MMDEGILSTIGPNGSPLGTFVTFVRDEFGQPIMRLRKDAVHTKNLEFNPKCSIFIKSPDYPAKLLARVSLIGEATILKGGDSADAAMRYSQQFRPAAGVDMQSDDDIYSVINVSECFFVGGLGTKSEAEVLPGDEFRSASADPLHPIVPTLVNELNEERRTDVIRIAAQHIGVGFDKMEGAELLWIDSIGMHITATVYGYRGRASLWVPFVKAVNDEREVRSRFTMASQVAWEVEREYVPSIPTAEEVTK